MNIKSKIQQKGRIFCEGEQREDMVKFDTTSYFGIQKKKNQEMDKLAKEMFRPFNGEGD